MKYTDMKNLKYILVLLVSALMIACQKDPMAEITEGGWNKERNIINIAFQGQIGVATIVRNGEDATIEFLYNSSDFSAIKLSSIELSYGATSSVNVGETLNFSGTGNTATITVTPVNGEPLVWTLKVGLYVNPYQGSWAIQTFRFKWDDWNGWGLAGEDNVAAKMTSVSAGLDDILTFGSIEGVDLTGSYYGSYERTKGADGNYGSYISPLGNDWSAKFGQLPNGKGKYFINPDNTISIEIEGSDVRINSMGVKTTDGTTMTYELFSPQIWTIDWDDYYGTENQLKVAYNIWYILTKQ